MNPIIDPQQALALINRPDVLALLAAQSNIQGQAARAASSSPGSELDLELDAEDETDAELDAEDGANKTLEWRDLDDFDENFNIIPKAKVISSEPIEISSNNPETSSESGASSDSAADISTDPEDEAGDEIDSEDEAAEETDPEIRSILASSDDELDEDESDEELLPPPEDIWYDSLDELQAAVQEHAIQHGYSITIKRTFTEREKKNFQCD